MSTLVEIVTQPESSIVDIASEIKETLDKKRRKKCGFKSKENIFKHPCSKELKRKLKKYKLRRDGQEDPEVLDVSQILVSTLKIKSPTSSSNSIKDINDTEEQLRPKNYLFKMGRRKQIIRKRDLDISNDDKEYKTIGSDGCHSPKSIINTKITKDLPKDEQETETKSSSMQNKDDKKHTNAFQLMMDSRNKSIGSNSPGKDKTIDESEVQDAIERKNLKVKRNLLLQKMAESKGSLKKKELEEYHEQCIQRKMEKRAERLKKMVLNKKPKPEVSNVPNISTNTDSPTNNNVHLTTDNKTLKLVNIFHDSLQNINDSSSKKVTKTKEDDEFLKKLSPSIKKKENMLCYFKKVEKEIDSDEVFSSQNVNDDDSVIIKVKMTPRSKKTKKKKKLSLNKVINVDSQNDGDDIECLKVLTPDEESEKSSFKSTKSKNIEKIDTPKETEICVDLDVVRPRRNVKRPAKYIDDVLPSSSDEELHIFTPKKKKHTKKHDLIAVNKMEAKPLEPLQNQCSEENKKSLKKNIKVPNKDKQPKPTKLAPIFATKPQLDAAAMEAKQRFLNSGVPEKLKKAIDKQSHKNVNVISCYETVVHVQQQESVLPVITCEFDFRQNDLEEDHLNIEYDNDFFKKIISPVVQPIGQKNSGPVLDKNKTNAILQKIKQLYPKFPVYRTYRLLREKNRGEFKDCSYLDLDNSIEVINGLIDISNESPDKLNWTDKYKAVSSKQIIGNFECIKELKKWLISWTENDVKLKKINGANSDSSDFYQSDTDSKDSMKSTNNLLVLTGPVGSGKTSIVYAVAAELAIKVLEVNASSKRTGKIMLQDLQEATQSHKVNRGKSSQDSSQKSQDVSAVNKKVIKIKKRGRPKKEAAATESTSKKIDESVTNNDILSQPSSQDSSRTCMSLILVDDADIVFEQDDGFCSAIVQLVQCSKRPVILITSSLACPHLQRFLQIAKIIQTKPFFPKMLGTWLDILTLADNGMCWPGLGAKILDYFNGDIRKSMNFLQFHMVKEPTNNVETASQNSDLYKIDVEDENSSMSWTDREGIDEKTEKCQANNNFDDKIWHCFMKDQVNMFNFKYPLQLFDIWWNIPRLLYPPSTSIIQVEGKIKECKDRSADNLKLDTISNVSDMLSIADIFRSNDMKCSLTSVPWANFESHSVVEQESLERYDRNEEIADEISHTLVTSSILKAQGDMNLESNTYLELPGMAVKRERDKVASRHNNVSSYLTPSGCLDRRALALDYWSTCRSICRIEKSRTDSNSKRNNRFCHYLKSVNILCKSDSFDNLGNSLSCNEFE